MHDVDFRKLLDALGLSWSGYRRVRKGVKKRISKHMQTIGAAKMDRYIERLFADPSVRTDCDRLMTVSISRFFRDRQLWEALEKEILPDLIQKTSNRLNVWSSGCACGEEAYSIGILWKRLQQKDPELPAIEILATDMNPTYLQKAQTGIYQSSSLKELDKTDLETFFNKSYGRHRYGVTAALKENIFWKTHHLLEDPPASGFHIVFLRNSILTYYETALKGKSFRNVIRTLAPSGLLIVGSHETIPETEAALRPVPPFPYVWIKEGAEEINIEVAKTPTSNVQRPGSEDSDIES
jgi:chemotaxis protein methyltransferase CheR